jgi:hypothetical protein
MRGKGWLDELWAVLLALPLLICFIPGAQGFAKDGFSVLASAPVWYQAGVGAALAFIFGKDRAASVLSRIIRK